MKSEIANQQTQVHEIPNQHTYLEKQFGHPKLQNCKKKHSPNGFLIKRNITTKHTKQ